MQIILVISVPKTMPSKLQSPPHSQKSFRQSSRVPRHSESFSHGRCGTQTKARHTHGGSTQEVSGQSSSVVQVGSGVKVGVGVERSRQTPSTQSSPGGQSSSSSQRMVGVGVGAGTQMSSGPHTCPTGQSPSA